MNEELKIIITAACEELVDACDDAQKAIEDVADEAEEGGGETQQAFGIMEAAAVLASLGIIDAMADAVSAIGDMVGECISAGDAIDKNAQKLQFSNDAYQSWSHVLRHGGTTIDSLKMGIKNTTDILGNLASGTDANTSAFDELGVSLYDANGNIRSTEDVVSDSLLALSDMDDITRRNAIAQDIFGRSASELYPTLNSGSDAIKEQLKYAQDYVNYSDEQIDACANVSDAQQNFKDSLDKVKMTLAEALLPAIETVTDKLTEFNQFCQDNPGLVEGVVIVVGILAGAIGALAGAWAVYTIAQTLANAVMALCPFVWIIAIIAAVIAIIVVLCTHWDEVKEVAAKCWDAIVKTVQNCVDAVVKFFQDLWNKLKEIWENIKSAASSIWEGIKSGISNIVNGIKTTVSNVWNGIKTTTSNVFNAVKSTASSVWEGIKTGISNVVNGIKTTVSNVWNSIKDVTSNAFNAVKTTVSNVWNGVKTSISNAINGAKSVVKSAIDTIKGVMNFSWKLPHLKLPHISISGSFSLMPPSVPSFGISWYAKGGVFDSPTLFGYGNGNLGGLGENGAEAIVPLEKNTQWLDKLAGMLNNKMGNGQPIVLNVDGKTFGEIAVSSINQLTRQRGSLGLNLY